MGVCCIPHLMERPQTSLSLAILKGERCRKDGRPPLPPPPAEIARRPRMGAVDEAGTKGTNARAGWIRESVSALHNAHVERARIWNPF